MLNGPFCFMLFQSCALKYDVPQKSVEYYKTAIS